MAKSPQTNGIVERFHKTMLDEFHRFAFRKKLDQTIEGLQADLDLRMREFNEARPHQGKWCFGKTPMQTFLDALPIARKNAPGPCDRATQRRMTSNRQLTPSVRFRARYATSLLWRASARHPIPDEWRTVRPRFTRVYTSGSRNASHPVNAILSYA